MKNYLLFPPLPNPLPQRERGFNVPDRFLAGSGDPTSTVKTVEQTFLSVPISGKKQVNFAPLKAGLADNSFLYFCQAVQFDMLDLYNLCCCGNFCLGQQLAIYISDSNHGSRNSGEQANYQSEKPKYVNTRNQQTEQE